MFVRMRKELSFVGAKGGVQHPKDPTDRLRAEGSLKKKKQKPDAYHCRPIAAF